MNLEFLSIELSGFVRIHSPESSHAHNKCTYVYCVCVCLYRIRFKCVKMCLFFCVPMRRQKYISFGSECWILNWHFYQRKLFRAICYNTRWCVRSCPDVVKKWAFRITIRSTCRCTHTTEVLSCIKLCVYITQIFTNTHIHLFNKLIVLAMFIE